MPVDWSALTSWRQALNWANKVESDKDIFQKSDQFTAKVLTDPTNCSAKELAGALGIIVSGESTTQITKFKGRIQGANSPHSFLPDPCKMDITKDPDQAKRAIALHTTFYYVNESEGALASDDDVRVALRPGQDMNAPFNLQIGHAIKKINKPGVASWLRGLLDGDEGACADLAGLPWDGSKPLGSSGGGSRASYGGAYAEPRDFTAEGAEQAITTEADESICEGHPDEFIMMHPLNYPPEELMRGAENFGQVDTLHPTAHSGADFGAPIKGFGATLYAVADGTIVSAGATAGTIKDDVEWSYTWAGNAEEPWGWIKESDGTDVGTGGAYAPDYSPTTQANGNYVSMTFDHPEAAELGLLAFYLHLADAPLVRPGQKVVQGQPIGFMGNTGYSKGFHLHWQINAGYYDLYGSSGGSATKGPINPMQWFKTTGPCKEYPLPPAPTEEEAE
jgi:hypothetical protein